ncbi:hypothetical protein [Phocaeicola vulgatus]|uniref:hypothetical protein n=1 Tax=Phocaeicola vulgatus TaxID=821 RepID=UPI001F428FB3|nr:hypothetical protein [Phocaeicola vulgatus]MCG0295274.1 hypothetical protein [Phocaeicola vulgatus]
MDLNNIVGFKAVDKNGNERQVTVDEMTELVSARIVSAASEISTFAAAAAAGTDEFEDQLPQSDTFSWLRTLDGSKNPTLTSSSAAAKVLGGLIGINDTWIRRRFAIKDCNTAIAGVYNVDDTTTNNFPTGAYKYGTLLVVNSGFFGSQYFVPDNFNADPYIYIRAISNNGTTFNKWAKIKVTIIT